MTVEALLLVVTTSIALVAAAVAVFALRSARDLKRSLETVQHERKTLHSSPTSRTDAESSAFVGDTNAEISVPGGPGTELVPHVVQGRVIVPPTQSQVVRTALGRPGVRLSILAHGLARALRPENRDRILALMRREYRHRRRERLGAGRQAIRMARPSSAPSTTRLHEHLRERPRAGTLTDRMLRP
jgi:hypothetical protein